ncbi:hypothetical protein ACF0H5_011666 [Mactra antiquata]
MWKLFIVCIVIHLCSAQFNFPADVDNGDWEPVYRIYEGGEWNSHDDYLSKEKSVRHGNKDDSQFRSWKIDQWHYQNIRKVRVQLFDAGYEVVNFEFDSKMENMTSFFQVTNLKETNYVDILGSTAQGDDFSIDGDGDSRHWTVSSRHVGNCRNDEGWLQVIDKPKPGRDRCVCGYENVDKYPTIMYAKGNRKAKWSNRRSYGHADMMQVSISHVPYKAPPSPTPPNRGPQLQTQLQTQLQQQAQFQPVHNIQNIYGNPFDFL